MGRGSKEKLPSIKSFSEQNKEIILNISIRTTNFFGSFFNFTFLLMLSLQHIINIKKIKRVNKSKRLFCKQSRVFLSICLCLHYNNTNGHFLLVNKFLLFSLFVILKFHPFFKRINNSLPFFLF